MRGLVASHEDEGKHRTLDCLVGLQVMREMLGKNMRQNLHMVVQIATAYSDQIGATSLIEMLESFKLYEGLFYYLGAIVNNSTVSRSKQDNGGWVCWR